MRIAALADIHGNPHSDLIDPMETVTDDHPSGFAGRPLHEVPA